MPGDVIAGPARAAHSRHTRKDADVAKSSKKTAAPLPDRLAKARREGRTQQALELARELFKHDPSEANREQLRQVLLERGRQLQEQGYARDAATVFANAGELGGPPEFLADVAERLANCGDVPKALAFAARLEDARAKQRVLGHAADFALRQGPAGKHLLPAELHPQFDLVTRAFAHAEAGRDDDAREALQGVGLTSPFLEWKLLLRGLLAYYANDDARALENWQRLDPRRLPARVAAPLRLALDRDFRQAQPAPTRQALQRQADRLLGTGLVAKLQDIQQALATKKSLAGAFRFAEALTPALRSDFPHLLPRLAHCYFWAVVSHGQPEDVDRYERVFGPVSGDADGHRLEAIALEKRGMWREAHKAWQDFIKAVAKSKAWPGDVGKRAQALLWAHLGNNAADEEQSGGDHPLFAFFRDKPRPFKPTAEECFRRSIELAPDRLDSYLALFRLYRDKEQTAKARQVGQELLQRFPDHAATSEALGDLCLEGHELDKARDYYEKALRANPLERRLRGKLGKARQNLALARTVEQNFDAARAEFEAAGALWEGPPGPLWCQRAVLEMKAKDDAAAEQWVARALGEPDQRLAVRYGLVGESVRAKLPPARRKKLADELNAVLAQDATPAEVLALLESAAAQRLRHLDAFRGQKTQEKAILTFLEKIPLKEFSEEQAERLCVGLHALDARKPWEKCLDRAERLYPRNPTFPLSRVEYYLSGRDPERRIFALRRSLEIGRRLIEELPPGPRKERLLQIAKQKEEQVRGLDEEQFEFLGMMNDIFDRAEGPDDGAPF